MDILTDWFTDISLQQDSDSSNISNFQNRKRKCKIATSPLSLKKERSYASKIEKLPDPDDVQLITINRLTRQRACQSKIFKNSKLLCQILKELPPNSLASVSNNFCSASYMNYRESLSKGECFVRSWMDTKVNNTTSDFSPELYFHKCLLSPQGNPNVAEIQTILTFATESSTNLLDSMKMPPCLLMGTTDVVFNGLRFVEEEPCFASLFVPKSEHILATTFSVQACYTKEKDENFLRNMISSKKRDSTVLKAIFWMQCNISEIFNTTSFPLDSETVLCAGVMSVANKCGIDDLALGLAIYGDKQAEAHLYDIDTNNERQVVDWMFKMKNEIPNHRKGFCIFLFSSSKPICKSKVLMWESDTEEETQCFYSLENKTNYDGLLEILQHIRKHFTYVKLIGAKSPTIFNSVGFQSKSEKGNASFLIITYPD